MDVLDDEQDGGRFPEAAKETEEPLEDPTLQPVASQERRDLGLGLVGQLGDEPGQLGRRRPERLLELRSRDLTDERPEDLDDRPERQAGLAERDAAAGQDERRVWLSGPSVGCLRLTPHPRDELGDEPALADPRLAVDEDNRRLPVGGRLDGALELRQLRAATHEDGAGDAT